MARLDYFAPGVYVEEVNKGSRAIQGISMSVAGFVGFTEDVRGDAELFEPVLITTWSQYLENFAKVGSDGFKNFGTTSEPIWGYLPFAVKGWFDNGGGRCWVVSIGTMWPQAEDYDEQESLPAGEKPPEGIPHDVLTDVLTSSKKPSLRLQLKGNYNDQKRLSVAIERDTPRSSEDGDEVFDTGEYFKVTIRRGAEILEGEMNADGTQVTRHRHLTMRPSESEEDRASGTYVIDAFASNSEYLTASLGLDRFNDPIATSKKKALAFRPANGVYEVRPPEISHYPKPWYQKTYGSEKRKTGAIGLFQIEDVAMVACPDLMLAYQTNRLDLDQLHGLMEMLITNCESAAPGPAYRMAVLDPPPVKPGRNDDAPVAPEDVKPQHVESWLMDSFGRRSQHAALYYPWIKVPNPGNAGKPITIPPSGHMMGMWCRTDETRGIHKAPANEIPRGVIGLAYDVNFREQELLNPKGINCIRKFRNRGTLVWGARTLAQLDDTNWRYVSVRRLMSYIEKSIEEGTQWAVFEPNDEDLWARVTRTVKNFLERIWRQGALFGSTPEDAFYVKCDRELNTPDTMKLGQLFIEVGICPVRPAEFVVFHVSQWDPSQDQT